MSDRKKDQAPAQAPIAIVGMSCLFPGSSGLKEYWANVRDGVDAITDVRLLRLDSNNLERLRKRYPRIGAQVLWNLSAVIANRLAHATDRENVLTMQLNEISKGRA